MRSFSVPIQITEEEKIFGGHLSLRQMAYVFMLGPCIGAGLASICPFGGMPANAILFVIGLTIGMAFAFVKIHEMGLDTYLWLAFKWWRSPKVYTWIDGGDI